MPVTKKSKNSQTTKSQLQPAPTPPPPAPPEVPSEPAVMTQSEPGLPVLYPTLEIDEYSTVSKKGPMTIERCKIALGWETESEFKARKMREFPGTKADIYRFDDEYHCRNIAGEKVRCNNNGNNRHFDMVWCEALIHTILYGNWAGPHTMPGETVNGETFRISKYGRVISAQHSMTACILAGEVIARDRERGLDPPENPKYPAWRKHGEPFIEGIMVKGISENPKVLQTVDYVKPRDAADVFYTSPLFRQSKPAERQVLCRMLAVAVDTLWTRTDAKGYRTHPEIVGFLERHMKLLDCIQHIHSENSANSERRINKLRLSAGTCSALMYIQGSSGPKTDGDIYRNESPPSEKNLDWSYLEKAEQFWTLLACGRDFDIVREALGRLVDSSAQNETNQGLGGRTGEKLAILAKAWEIWKDTDNESPFDISDLEPDGALSLSYTDLDDKGNKLPDGAIKLIEVADFYGIDSPEVVDPARRNSSTRQPDPPPPVGANYEELKEQARARRAGK